MSNPQTVPWPHLYFLFIDGKQDKSGNKKTESKHHHCANGKPIEILLSSINL